MKKLEIKPINITVKFEGIDDWNRPVFKNIESNSRYGSTNKLYGYKEFQESGLDFFKKNPQELEYFGRSFNCEPHGGLDYRIKLNVID